MTCNIQSQCFISAKSFYSTQKLYFNCALPNLFSVYFILSIQLTEYKIADDWIETTDLWFVKQLIYQLSHNNWLNHCKGFINS